MNKISKYLSLCVVFILASVYVYPIFLGLILLPLDLLVTESGPWHWASTIYVKNSYMKDSILQMFPWRHITFESLSTGVIPLWNPYQFLGMPFMASMKSLVFYPGNILFIFGEVTAWNILLWLQIFLSMIFMYYFMNSIGLTGLYGYLPSIAFGLNSLMMGVLQFGSEGHVLLWLPFLLYLIQRSWFKAISIIVAAILFAGHLQYGAYVLILGFIFAIIHKKSKAIIIAFLLGLGIAAIQIIPGVELFTFSYRGLTDNYQVFSQGLLLPKHLLRLISPDWFGNPVTRDIVGGYIEMSGYFGIVPLFFAIYALLKIKSDKYIKFFAYTALVSLLLSINGIAQILYYFKVPVITSGYGARIFSLFLFSGAVLSGFGLKIFIESENKHKIRTLVIWGVIIGAIFIFGSLSRTKIQIAASMLLILFGWIFIRYGKIIRYSKILFIIVICAITYADLFRMGYRFLTFSNPKYLYPELSVTKFVQDNSKTSLGRIYGLTEPEIESVFKIQSVETYNPLYPQKTALLLQALQGKQSESLPINKYYLEQNRSMKHVLDFLGVSMVAVRSGKNPALEYWGSAEFEKDITKIYSYEGNDIYKNLTVYPRFNLFYDIQENVPDTVALEAISKNTIDFNKKLLLSDNLVQSYIQGTGSAQLLHYSLNEQKFRIITDSPSVFYISDTYFPGWHVSIDGKKSKILRANYNFRAVEVPQGESILRFWYLPDSFVIGAFISVVSLGVLLVKNRTVKK